MKSLFADIFEYHHYFNQKLADQLFEHKNILPDRTIPLFCHTVNAHQIWNARILNKEAMSVNDVHELADVKKIDSSNYDNTLTILKEKVLQTNIKYKNSKGTSFENTINQILFHISNHFSHHKGQIISDIRQSGLKPMITDYIFYKR